ncbi:DUF262 domain-containing protein [Jejudonia soesokkakensis]|uniref:DUF262 domain-containing protein n=1 Tax=Jejudonia soesokkakensis TaxID=1323432 RepID=A0ABW2MS33_9FLAO
MQFKPTTILGLFDSSQKHYIIPVYQRAYSWDADNWNTFLTDLKEQVNGDNNYFYGNLLFETIKKDITYEVIDGQQRLTTLSIFFRAIIDVLKLRKEKEKFEFEPEIKESIYLKNAGNVKLRVVEYDQACFESVIVEGKEKFSTATPSQVRILKAKNHFKKELNKLDTSVLLKILNKVEETEITSIELAGKKDSALMFELQNNRGKDLTNMEKIKSYFMYQMYVYSSEEETEGNVAYVSNIFKLIYLIINDLKTLNEDSVLIYHCNAYVKGFNYRTLDDIKEKLIASKNKVKWIKDFADELHTSFSNIKKMDNSNDKYLKDLRNLSIPVFVYPFVIKGYKFFGDDNKKLNTLYHILEIAVFRYKLINSRADLISRLNEILTAFNGDLETLRTHFKDKFNDAYYWGDDRMYEYLDGYMYKNSVLNYLLWKYENHIQNKGYDINNGNIEDEQIEHISPQTPTDGDPLASGYEVTSENIYDEDFLEQYLNCLGNLMLISGSHNKSIGNIAFSQKLKSYKDNPLLNQQAEIKNYTEEEKWTKTSIGDRHENILDNFAVMKWSFDNVAVN